MIRGNFQEKMKELEQEIVTMSEMVINATTRSIEALKMRDISEAEKVITEDFFINKKRWGIEEKCIDLIATQQPVATDLRELITILNIIVDLERMGDHAEGIAKIVVMLGEEPFIKPLIDIPKMTEKTVNMIKMGVEAFVTRDVSIAREVCARDDEVDMLYNQVYCDLLSIMTTDKKTITRGTHLIWTAHNLERIADRATNICERIIFLVTGEMENTNVSIY